MNETERYWAKFFKDICPYTGRKCEDWNCPECEVEQSEREFVENDKECPYYDSEAETCRRSETEFDELNNLYYGMTDSMQKAVKDIMLSANGKEIEE